jgi:hypothetical protein
VSKKARNHWLKVTMHDTTIAIDSAQASGRWRLGIERLAVFSMLLVSSAAFSQAAYKAPRGPGGHPDLNGVWQVLNTANWDIEPHEARPALAVRPGPAGPVPAKEVLALGAIGAVPGGPGVVEGNVVPYKPEALKQKKENQQHALQRDPEVKCYLPGVPRANYMPFPFQIIHNESHFFIAYEYAGAARDIFFKDPGAPPAPSWMGHSVGRWEGDTLVVEVTNQNGDTWFDRSGNFHSEELRVIERYTPTSPYTMTYEATIEDSQTFTRPWKMSMTLYKRVGKDAQLGQFKCVPFVEELIYGKLRKQPLQ